MNGSDNIAWEADMSSPPDIIAVIISIPEFFWESPDEEATICLAKFIHYIKT
jgi:hypothetical protein